MQEGWSEPPGVKRRIAGLKKEIKEMGPVDPQAIEDYEKLTERINFLSNQYEDLTVARAKLEQVIEEIEKKIKVQFIETFNQVREAFIDLFGKLFSGGRADLKLLDPEDPGIRGSRFWPQPGKRLQNFVFAFRGRTGDDRRGSALCRAPGQASPSVSSMRSTQLWIM